MKLLSVIVTHGRLELTKVTVRSYRETVSVPHVLVAADNASDDATREWLDYALERKWLDALVLFDDNRYPGAAVNHVWANGLELLAPDATHVHRSDNDVLYLPGWCEEVERAFARAGAVGQVGLMLEKYEAGATNVGGNSVIDRRVLDAGVRWREEPWPQLAGAATEDTYYSHDVTQAGFRVARVERESIRHLGWDFDEYPDYYRRTAAERELDERQLRSIFDEMRRR